MFLRNAIRPATRALPVRSIFMPNGSKTIVQPFTVTRTFNSSQKLFTSEQKQKPQEEPENPFIEVIQRQENPLVDDAQDTIFTPNAKQRNVAEIDSGTVIYLGPLSGPVRIVKRISISSLFITTIGAPILLTFGETSVPFVARVIACSAVMIFSACTTFLVTLTCSSYVTEVKLLKDKKTEEIHKIELEKLKSYEDKILETTENANPSYFNDTTGCYLEIKTLNLFGSERSVIAPIDEIKPASNMMGTVNFAAGGKKIFIHSFLLEESGNRWLVDKIKEPPKKNEPVAEDDEDD